MTLADKLGAQLAFGIHAELQCPDKPSAPDDRPEAGGTTVNALTHRNPRNAMVCKILRGRLTVRPDECGGGRRASLASAVNISTSGAVERETL
jgi:hypothetical protein